MIMIIVFLLSSVYRLVRYESTLCPFNNSGDIPLQYDILLIIACISGSHGGNKSVILLLENQPYCHN